MRVGSYKPNAWGFYDMHGNVKEACRDHRSWDGMYSYSDATKCYIDPKGPVAGAADAGTTHYVFRGGSYATDPRSCTSGYRGGGGSSWADQADRYAGFRLAYMVNIRRPLASTLEKIHRLQEGMQAHARLHRLGYPR